MQAVVRHLWKVSLYHFTRCTVRHCHWLPVHHTIAVRLILLFSCGIIRIMAILCIQTFEFSTASRGDMAQSGYICETRGCALWKWCKDCGYAELSNQLHVFCSTHLLGCMCIFTHFSQRAKCILIRIMLSLVFR